MIHFFYGMVFFGFLNQIPRYVYFWNIFVQVSLCLFLMYNYNPFRTEYKISIYDAKMIFGAASILLINIISLPYLLSIVEMGTGRIVTTATTVSGENVHDHVDHIMEKLRL
jgi:hypothetical protein